MQRLRTPFARTPGRPPRVWGIWLFLASEAMFFGALFAGYVMLRAGASDWPAPFGGFPWLETALLAAASLSIGRTRARLLGSAVFAFVVRDRWQADELARLSR